MQFPVFLFALAFFSSLWSCNEGNVELDNAGDSRLSVRVDELTFDLPPGARELIQLERGRHTLVIKDSTGTALEETTFSVDKGGLLNLARSNYYVWTDLYGKPALKEKHLNEEWLKLDDQSIYGEFTQLPSEELYIEKVWDYGLEESFPEYRLGMNLEEDKFVLESKLFRETELVEAYYQQTEEAEQ